MRKTVYFTFFLLFLYTSLLAQSEKKKVSAQSEKKKGTWTATLTGALIPISQPGLGIQPGVEYKFNDRFSLLAEITLRANKKNSKDSSELNKQYIRYKTEIRYHFTSKRKKSQQYAGLQLTRASRKFINRGGFYYNGRQGNDVIFYDQASLNSPVVTASLQFGSIISYRRFALDFFAGIGARFIHTTITDIVNPVIGARDRGRD